MNNLQVLTIHRSHILTSAKFIVLIGIATFAPLFREQIITGTIINATLFVSTIVLGTQMSIFVGLIPSVIALSVGTLPPVLAPMIPYIMISNILLIYVFGYLNPKNYWLAVGVASLLKFAFLFATSFIVIGLLMKKELANSVSNMMSIYQLFTALAGGIVAYVFIGYRKK